MIPALTLTQVSKRYRLGTGQGSLRDLIAGFCRGASRSEDGTQGAEHIWALRDLSLEVPRGSVMGVIGSNGAGKTTLLKLLSRVTRPTMGRIDACGRMSSLIELGAGFHPDLTGRENVFLNGAILGMSRREIHARFADIVEFAGLDRFIDTPVKRYSSGMYARLGFAVAAHADPDILVVDEVLAVGDGPFQRKCYEFMQNFIRSERTVVFVSHNMSVIEQLCSQVLWIDHGEMRLLGPPRQVLPAYFDAMDRQALDSQQGEATVARQLRLEHLRVTDCDGTERGEFRSGEDIVVQLRYSTPEPIRRPHFCLGITGPESGAPLFLASMLVDGEAPDMISGSGIVSCRFRTVPLQPRAYQVWGEVWDSERVGTLAEWQRLGVFHIGLPDEQRAALGKGGLRHLRADGPVRVAYEWAYEPGA